MCVIIDACVRDLVFATPPSTAAVPVLKWIEEGDGRMAYGGTKLCNELFRSVSASRRIKAWKQAGRAMQFRNSVVDAEESVVRAMNVASSNDVHILALARVSGARVLFSSDGNLHADFKNPAILNKPRGTIYQTKHHSKLLKHEASCSVSAGKSVNQLY
jgi:hypothetical protein